MKTGTNTGEKAQNPEELLGQFKAMQDLLGKTANLDLAGEMKKVRSLMQSIQPKATKRILIGTNKATATLGTSDNVMIDFDDPVQGKKFYDSFTLISDVSSNNS